MTTAPSPPDHDDGTEVLTQEIKDEAASLVAHPVAELQRLENVAADGESPATPLLVIVAVTAVVALLATLAIAVALLAYHAG